MTCVRLISLIISHDKKGRLFPPLREQFLNPGAIKFVTKSIPPLLTKCLTHGIELCLLHIKLSCNGVKAWSSWASLHALQKGVVDHGLQLAKRDDRQVGWCNWKVIHCMCAVG